MPEVPGPIRCRIDTAHLDHELARRGLSVAEFSRLSGIHPATLSAIRNGRPAYARQHQRIAAALAEHPPVPELDALLSVPGVTA